MRLILTRHGETEFNRQRIMQGQIDVKLNDNGRQQAKLLAERLKDENIDVIYSSDLSRAFETAKVINMFHDKILHSTKDLRERDMGEFEAKSRDEVWPQGAPFPQPKLGENDEQLKARAKMFYDFILRKHEHDSVLLVGHGGINTALLSVALGRSIQEIVDMGRMENTSVSILDITYGNAKIVHLNCAQHLSS